MGFVQVENANECSDKEMTCAKTPENVVRSFCASVVNKDRKFRKF